MPATAADKEAVREQMGRILSSTLFRNSKRFPAFLRYTVEHALSSTDPLKERTIGHQVFARDPGYDTNQDPIVRMTAGEVRRRLHQYYQSPERRADIVIAYEPGSYVPEIIRPATQTQAPVEPSAVAAPRAVATASPPWRRWALAAAGVAAAAIAVATLMAPTWRGATPVDTVRRFWAPILASSSPVLICIGDPSPVSANTDAASSGGSADVGDLTIDEFLRVHAVRYTDSVTLALIAGELRARDKPFRIRRPAATELKDLRDGPVVLIGGFNNPWTLRLSEGLRFTLAADANGSYVRDGQHPDSRQWQLDVPGRLLKNMQETYGLITRVEDPSTGHSVLTVSGLVFGTRAAVECLLDAECLQSAPRLGTGDVNARNVQIVVSAAVIGEDSGAPRVLALHSW